jgi:hypothetical protein
VGFEGRDTAIAATFPNRLEKRSQALRGRNPTRDIQAPVRQWRVGPPMAFVVGGRILRNDLRLRTLETDEPQFNSDSRL